MTWKMRLIPLLALLAIGACQDTGPVDHPPLSFERYQPIHVAVSSIQIVDEYKSPGRLPNVEHLMPYSPAEAMEIWTRDRLRAVGADKSLTIIIKDASVVQTDLPKQKGFKGFFTSDPDKRYEAKLEVEMRIYSERALSDASIQVHAARAMTMSENASVSTRDVAYRKMVAELMDMINAEVEQNMYLHMANYISYSQNP